MDVQNLNPQPSPDPFESPQWTLTEAIPEFACDAASPRGRRVWLPLLLFIATCASTLLAGTLNSDHYSDGWRPALIDGLMYSAAVMTILLCHEMGHFLQAVRYGVQASLPYFIPMPIPPIGTFGAVIGMEPRCGDRKAIFDIGITGPLAGLVPTLVFLCLGLHWSELTQIKPHESVGMQLTLGEPLLMQYITDWIKGPIPDGFNLVAHPVAFAGWFGLFLTSINLMPVGQLDGGHILYAMFPSKAHVASAVLMAFAIFASITFRLTGWWLMLGLIAIMGIRHPPTSDDSVPLGAGRYMLGILTLAFLFLGFTPVPMSIGH